MSTLREAEALAPSPSLRVSWMVLGVCVPAANASEVLRYWIWRSRASAAAGVAAALKVTTSDVLAVPPVKVPIGVPP
jgi:hypothetical protein